MFSKALIATSAQIFEEESEGHHYYPRPSMMGPERCIRQMVYHGLNYDRKPFGGRAANVLNDSSWHEELTIDLMRKSAFQVHSEQMGITIPDAFYWRPEGEWECRVCKKQGIHPMINNHDCHGHIDWIATDLLRVDRLIEHKALSHFGYEGILNRTETKLDYLTQMATYMRGLQLVNPDLFECILLVKNKNQSGYLELRCSYDSESDTLVVIEMAHHTGDLYKIDLAIEGIFSHAVDKLHKVDQYIAAKKLPRRQYDVDTWQCSYCGFGDQCWKDYMAEHALFQAGTEIQSAEIVMLIEEDRALLAEQSKINKQRDEIKEKLKEAMAALNIRHGFTEAWEIRHIIGVKDQLDKTLIEQEILAKATVEVPDDRLQIKKRKAEKAEKGKKGRKKS